MLTCVTRGRSGRRRCRCRRLEGLQGLSFLRHSRRAVGPDLPSDGLCRVGKDGEEVGSDELYGRRNDKAGRGLGIVKSSMSLRGTDGDKR